MEKESGLDLGSFDIYMKKEHVGGNSEQISEPVKQPTPEELQARGQGSNMLPED